MRTSGQLNRVSKCEHNKNTSLTSVSYNMVRARAQKNIIKRVLDGEPIPDIRTELDSLLREGGFPWENYEQRISMLDTLTKRIERYLSENPVSDEVANQIIEKLISLVITDSTKNKIEKLIPDYCFSELKQTLEIVANLDFLTHDKDDLNKKKKIPYEKIKSATKRKKEDSLFVKENEKLQNSEIIRNYNYKRNLLVNNSLDDCSLDLDVFNLTKNELKEREEEKKKEKIVMGILIREDFNDNMTSFQKEEKKKQKLIDKHNKIYNFPEDKDKVLKEVYGNENEPFKINPEEKIDTIKKVEIHKIEIYPSNQINNKISNIDIPFDSKIDSTNFWKTLPQPISAPIDRDAGTKIKYEKPAFQNKKGEVSIIDENHDNTEEINNSHKKNKKENPKKKLKISFLKKKNENTEKNKKKKYIQIDFESTDLAKVYESQYETNETTELRMEVEKELQEKKKEMEKIAQKEKERVAKEEEVAELRKKLNKKNVTVDIKGELVFIKPLDLQALTEEFNKGRANFKNIKTIEKEMKSLNAKPSLVIEKNLQINDDTKDNKATSKKQKRRNPFGTKNNNTVSPIAKKNVHKQIIDKNMMKQIAGSNFSIINPEVGVNIKEEKKMKSGGKDFYKKYNRFSVEVFQDQLNKTAASNLFPKISEQIVGNIKVKKKASLSLKPKKIEEEKSKTIIPPNEKNNTLSLKTKNLKYALENLDLITDGEERDLSKTKKIFKKNIMKKRKNKIDKRKIDYDEMNVFAKTLMGSHNWGRVLYNDSKKDFKYKMPTKPEENELQRELPVNLLKHMPRKRLPPIGNSFRINRMEQTISNRKPNKLKLRIGENKNITQTEKDEN